MFKITLCLPVSLQESDLIFSTISQAAAIIGYSAGNESKIKSSGGERMRDYP